MNLKSLQDTPPWEWPEGSGTMFLGILRDEQADESERLLATELAGDSTVVNDELADALLAIVCNGDEPEDLRAQAVISLGPALEYAYIDEFDDPEYVPISEQTFSRIQKTLRKLYTDAGVPKEVGGVSWRHRCAPRRTGTGMLSVLPIPATTKIGD